jgi:hypothetical protein
MFDPNSKILRPTRARAPTAVVDLCLKAGLATLLAAFLLLAGSSLLPGERAAQAASLPGPGAQSGVAALPDTLVCDVSVGPFSSVFSPFAFNTGFFNSGFFNTGFLNTGFFNPGFNNGFFNNGFFVDSDSTCISSCSGGFPAALLPALCSAPVGSITAVSTLNSMTCGSNQNLTFKVTNNLGLIVADGTPVAFTASLARVTPTTMTTSGQVTVSVMVPPRTSGLDTITATSGGVSTQYTLVVTC